MTAWLNPKVILSAVFGVVLIGLLSFYFFVIRPADIEAARLRTQLEAVIQDRNAAERQLNDQKAQMSWVGNEIQRLKLFDLRDEQTFDTVLANRSNTGLIALSEILQRNGITIVSLSPGPIDQQAILVQQVPKGGVLHRRYQLRAQGRYQDVQNAFGALKDLPPTLDIDHYSIKYVGAEGSHAKVSFELGFGFNFLVTDQQLQKFAELASASVEATASFDDLEASEEPVSPQMAPATPSAPISATNWWNAIATWIDPPAVAAPEKARKEASKSQGGSPKTYSFSVDKGVTLGRADPFMPLGETLEPKGTSSIKPGLKPQAAFPETSLMAVLLTGNGPASALLQYGTERMRVRPGSLLAGGAQVAAIGKDFVLIRFQGSLRRIGLRSEATPTTFSQGMANPSPPSNPASPIAPKLEAPMLPPALPTPAMDRLTPALPRVSN